MAVASTALADDSVAGKWKGQFDSAIGLQKYSYEFKVDGDKLTGKAVGEREMGTNEVAITEGKISKDTISFVEQLKFDDNDIRIEYTGKLAGDEIKFTAKSAISATRSSPPNGQGTRREAGNETRDPGGYQLPRAQAVVGHDPISQAGKLELALASDPCLNPFVS